MPPAMAVAGEPGPPTPPLAVTDSSDEEWGSDPGSPDDGLLPDAAPPGVDDTGDVEAGGYDGASDVFPCSACGGDPGGASLGCPNDCWQLCDAAACHSKNYYTLTGDPYFPAKCVACGATFYDENHFPFPG